MSAAWTDSRHRYETGTLWCCSVVVRTSRLRCGSLKCKTETTLQTATIFLSVWNMKCTQQFAIRLCDGKSEPVSNYSFTVRRNMDHRQPVFQFKREVCMELTMRQSARAMADVMSGILNLVCPDCGGRLGGPGKEFKCQGKCQTDWRQVWEGLLSSEISGNSRKATRSI
jgi:hypothetical protein